VIEARDTGTHAFPLISEIENNLNRSALFVVTQGGRSITKGLTVGSMEGFDDEEMDDSRAAGHGRGRCGLVPQYARKV
jgi:hypothetical protein